MFEKYRQRRDALDAEVLRVVRAPAQSGRQLVEIAEAVECNQAATWFALRRLARQRLVVSSTYPRRFGEPPRRHYCAAP